MPRATCARDCHAGESVKQVLFDASEFCQATLSLVLTLLDSRSDPLEMEDPIVSNAGIRRQHLELLVEGSLGCITGLFRRWAVRTTCAFSPRALRALRLWRRKLLGQRSKFRLWRRHNPACHSSSNNHTSSNYAQYPRHSQHTCGAERGALAVVCLRSGRQFCPCAHRHHSDQRKQPSRGNFLLPGLRSIHRAVQH